MARQVNGIAVIETNRFSEFVHPSDAEGMQDLHGWVVSFLLGGIEAAMVFTDKGYAVYREGMEQPYDDID